jgi:hypothetical protein
VYLLNAEPERGSLVAEPTGGWNGAASHLSCG